MPRLPILALAVLLGALASGCTSLWGGSVTSPVAAGPGAVAVVARYDGPLTPADLDLLERRLAGTDHRLVQSAPDEVEIRVAGVQTPEAVAWLDERVTAAGRLTFHRVDDASFTEAERLAAQASGAREQPDTWGPAPAGTHWAVESCPDPCSPLLLFDTVELDGSLLERAEVQVEPELNRFTVGLQLDSEGARRFEDVTRRATRQRLAIVLDGVVVTAPMINERIGGGRAVIHLAHLMPQEQQQEADRLARILNGSLSRERSAFESILIVR